MPENSILSLFEKLQQRIAADNERAEAQFAALRAAVSLQEARITALEVRLEKTGKTGPLSTLSSGRGNRPPDDNLRA